MGVSMGKTGRSEVSEINMTPMIDVLLVLLVIFMVAQPLLQKSIDLQLPQEPKDKEPVAATTQIVMEITPGPQIKINSQPVPAAQLEAKLREVYTGRPDKIIFVKADPNVIYQDVINSLDAARGAGVKVIGAVLNDAAMPTGGIPPAPAK
jgi:biopolymer transport protein TolR